MLFRSRYRKFAGVSTGTMEYGGCVTRPGTRLTMPVEAPEWRRHLPGRRPKAGRSHASGCPAIDRMPLDFVVISVR